MTKEQIQNEAVEYAKGKYGGENARMWSIAQIHAGRDGFIAGADWRINSVWHKPEEVPEEGKSILTINNTALEYDKVGTRITNPPAYWPLDVEFGDIIRWAYIKDLIPTEDERDS